jgi:succinyl-diaminopimelate desuccinylase
MDAKALKASAFEALERRLDVWVGLACELLRRSSENPPGDVTAAADYVGEALTAHGLAVERIELRPGNVNLVCSLEAGPGPHLVLNGHLDVFPAGDLDRWSFSPTAGDVVAGRIRGRGAADMKGGLAASLAAFLLIHELGGPPRGRLTLMVVADEESGSAWGTEWLLANRPELVPDACVIGEASARDAMRIGEKGVAWMRLRTTGQPKHGSLGTGRDAISRMAEAILVIRTITNERREPPDDLAPLLAAAREHAWADTYRGSGELLDRPTCTFGRIRGGVKINMAPQSCELEVDLRVPFGLTPAGLWSLVRDRLSAAGLGDLELEPVDEAAIEPTYTRPDHSLVRVAAGNVAEAIGRPPLLTVSTGFTDARLFRKRGVPAVVYGPTPFGVAAPDEQISVDDFLAVAKVHAGTAIDYLANTA